MFHKKKYDDILLDILRWKVYENYVSIDLHVAKLIQESVNNILKLGPLHITTESRSHSGGLIFGSSLDSAESFDPVSFNSELTTEGRVAGRPRTKMVSGYSYIHSPLIRQQTGGNHAGNK